MTTVPITDIKIGERHRKDLGDIDALAKSINEVGLLQPVVLTPDLELVAGHRRIEALKRLGLAEVPARVLELSPVEMLQAEHDENEVRKNFTPSELVAIGRTLEVEVAKAAEARKRATQAKPGEGKVGGDLEVTTGNEQAKTRDIVADALGVSGMHYQRAKRVVEAAEADPESFGDLVDQMDETGSVAPIFDELKRRKEGTTEKKKHMTRGIPSNMYSGGTKKGFDRLLTAVTQVDAAAHILGSEDITALDPEQLAQLREALEGPYLTIYRFRKELGKEAVHA
jgi:ParB-like chromosome segregation protein Spo0J